MSRKPWVSKGEPERYQNGTTKSAGKRTKFEALGVSISPEGLQEIEAIREVAVVAEGGAGRARPTPYN